MMKCFLVFLLLLQLKAFSIQQTQTYQVALYYSHRCPHSQKVLSYLKESHTQVDLRNVLRDPQAKKELQEYGGYMIVPCLVVNGRAIYDASDIIEWLSTHQQDLNKSPS